VHKQAYRLSCPVSYKSIRHSARRAGAVPRTCQQRLPETLIVVCESALRACNNSEH